MPGGYQPSFQRAEKAAQGVLRASAGQWQERGTFAINLAQKIEELLPRTGQREDELAAVLGGASGAASSRAGPASPGRAG